MKPFAAYLEVRRGCWHWVGVINKNGLPMFYVAYNRYISARKHAYLTYNGPIPRGHFVKAKCRNDSCVNPAHLFLIEHGLLVVIGLEKSPRKVKRACKRGHAKTKGNGKLYIYGQKRVWRCRQCHAQTARERRQRIREVA